MRKLLSILTLLVACVTGAWAADYIWDFSNSAYSNTYSSITKNTSHTFTSYNAFGSTGSTNGLTMTYYAGNNDKWDTQSKTITVNGESKSFTNQLYLNGVTSSGRYIYLTGLSGSGYLTVVTGTNSSSATIWLGTTYGSTVDDTKLVATITSSSSANTAFKSGLIENLEAETKYYINFSVKSYLFAVIWTPAVAAEAPSIPTFTVDGGSVTGGTSTIIASTNAQKIYYCWSESSTAPEVGDASYTAADGNSYATTIPQVNGTRYLHAYGWNNYNTSSASSIKSASFTITSLAASDLAVSSGKGTINTTVGAANYTLTSSTDFTTSSDGTLSFASSVPGVAYVDASTGEIQFVGAGTTTITLTQADGTGYEGGSVEYTVNVLPTTCLNLGDKDAAITQLKKGWQYDSPYFDTTNKLMIMSAYSAYSTANQGYQPWIGMSKNTEGKSSPNEYTGGGTSSKGTWDAATPFMGKGAYYRDGTEESKVRYATTNSSRPWTLYQFRVKGITAAQALVKGNRATDRCVSIKAYEITDGALASTAAQSDETTDNNVTTIAVTALDANKEYLIVVGNTVYTSNLDFYEIAFTASASDIDMPSNRITTSAAGWASYTPMYNVSPTIYKPGSSSAASDIKVYAISEVADGNASLAEVTSGTEKGMKAGEGYFLKGAANTTYRTTATGGIVNAPAANLIKGVTESGNVKSDATHACYALLTYDAERYGLYHLNTTGVTMPAGRAYLEVSVDASRASNFLNFDYGNEPTSIDEESIMENGGSAAARFFNLAGQEVQKPTKGLFIKNGKKVIVK